MRIINGKDTGKTKILLCNCDNWVQSKDLKVYKIFNVQFTPEEIGMLIDNKAKGIGGFLFDRYELTEHNTFKRKKINYGY